LIHTITLNPAIDEIVYLEENLTAEKNNKIKLKKRDLGGKSTHVSAVLTQLNIDNIATGFLGEQNKTELTIELDRYNIKHQFMELENQKTRKSTVIINKNGETYMLTEQGLSISENSKRNLHHYINTSVNEGDIVVIGGTPPQKFSTEDFKELIKILKNKHTFIACDVAKEYLKVAIEEEVHFVKPNEHEIEYLYPMEKTKIKKLHRIYKKVPYAICSLGAEGVLYKSKNIFYRMVPPSVRVRSDTGAGDAFVGGFIYGIYSNLSFFECIEWGILCSVSKVKQSSSCSINTRDFESIKKNIKNYEVI